MPNPRSFTEYVGSRFYNELCDAVTDVIEEKQDALDLNLRNVHTSDSIEVTDVEVKHVWVNDLPGMEIEFDVAVCAELYVHERDYHYDESETAYKWFMVSFRGDLEKELDDVAITGKDIYNGKGRYQNPLDDALVPVIKPEQLEKVAEQFLRDHYPKALLQPIWLEPTELAGELGLKVIRKRITKEGDIFGRIFFYDAVTEIYDPDQDKIVKKKARAKMILVDPEAAYQNNIGALNNTIVHECVHWGLHRKAFMLEHLYNKELTQIGCVVRGGIAGNKKDSTDWMEWQANALAPRIQMPKDMFKKRVDALISKFRNTTTESLSVTNTVPRGSLQITKTARKNDAAGSGTFWYAVYAEEYDPYAATHPAPVSSGSITVGADGTGTDTVSDLLYGTYYVYELDGENGTPIVSNGDSVWHSIGGTVYRVTGSGTTATVQSGTTPTAALQNETFTVDVSVKKIWVTPANMTAPESIVMRLSNNQEVTLTAPSWQGTISNLPKYDHNGDLIEYSWTEGSMPAGYVLTDQSEADGTTTFTNSYTDSYRPVMEIKGVKVWDDEGDEHRPGSIIVKLYKDGVLYATQTVTAPVEDLDADQWPFRFTNLPIFNDDGTLAQYTIEEELPAGYSGDYKITQEFSTASYEMGDIQGEIVNSGQGSQTFKVSEGVDLGYIVIRHGNDFIIWTPRPATDDEISSIKTKVAALSDQFNGINTASGNSLKIISGVPKTIDVGGERFYQH